MKFSFFEWVGSKVDIEGRWLRFSNFFKIIQKSNITNLKDLGAATCKLVKFVENKV